VFQQLAHHVSVANSALTIVVAIAVRVVHVVMTSPEM
jgi:hypothetical protein